MVFFDCMNCSHCTKNRLLSISWKADNVSDINMGRDNKMNKLMRRVMTCIVSAMCVLALFVPVYADNDVYHNLPMVYLHTGETKEIDLGLEEGDKISSAEFSHDEGIVEVTKNERTLSVKGLKSGQAYSLTAWTENRKCYSVDFSVGSEIQSVNTYEYYSKFILTKRPGEEGIKEPVSSNFQYTPSESKYIATEGKPKVLDETIVKLSTDEIGRSVLSPIMAGSTKLKTTITDNLTGKTYDVYQDVDVLEGDYADGFSERGVSVVLKVGEEIDLNALLRKSYLLPENREFTDEIISFNQDGGGTNIVSLSSNGIVKGLMGGTASITAQLTNGRVTTVSVTVTTDEQISMSFGQKEIGVQLPETSLEYRPTLPYLTITPDYMRPTVNLDDVQYSSSDESVFTIENDARGIKCFALKKDGEATLTATYKDLTASILVHVYKAGTKPTDFSIPETVTIGEGFAYNLTPTYTPAYLRNISYKCEVIKGEDVVGLSYGYTNISADSKLYSSLESETSVKIAAKKTGTAEVKVSFAHDPSVFKIIKVTVDNSSPKPSFSLRELPDSVNEKPLGEADSYQLTYGYEYAFNYAAPSGYCGYKNKVVDYYKKLRTSDFLQFNFGGIVAMNSWEHRAVASMPGTYKLTFDDGVTKTFTVSAKPAVEKPAVDTKDVETVTPEKINSAIADTQTEVSKAVSQEQMDSTVKKLTEEKNDWFYEKDTDGNIKKDENGNPVKKSLSSLESTVYLKSDVKEEEKSLVYDITPTLKIKAIAAKDEKDVMTAEEEIEINEPITMSLAVGDKFKASKLYITHTKDNGQQYVYEGTQQDGVVTFENPHGFSTFTISEERPDIVNPAPTPTPEVTPTPGTQPTPAPGTTGSAATPSKDNKGTSSSAQTGVKTNLGGFAGIVGIAVIAAGLVIVLKKKFQ